MLGGGWVVLFYHLFRVMKPTRANRVRAQEEWVYWRKAALADRLAYNRSGRRRAFLPLRYAAWHCRGKLRAWAGWRVIAIWRSVPAARFISEK